MCFGETIWKHQWKDTTEKKIFLVPVEEQSKYVQKGEKAWNRKHTIRARQFRNQPQSQRSYEIHQKYFKIRVNHIDFHTVI